MRELFLRSVKNTMINIIKNSNHYVLDYVDGRNDKLPALTRKNADFIEAVVRLDPIYARDLNIVKPSKGYDPDENAESAKGMYCGSTAYWFSEMKKPDCDFKKCVLGAIIAIDSTNKTHLEASEHGRKTMRDIICKHCNNYHDLVSMLNRQFNASDKSHIISLLSINTKAKKGDGDRYNISFATKFCAYASSYLETEIKYSKYDNIVSDALPIYVSLYLDEEKDDDVYKINPYKLRKFVDDDEKFKYRLSVYEKYSCDISKIINKLNDDNIVISRVEFDHIIWYGYRVRLL